MRPLAGLYLAQVVLAACVAAHASGDEGVAARSVAQIKAGCAGVVLGGGRERRVAPFEANSLAPFLPAGAAASGSAASQEAAVAVQELCARLQALGVLEAVVDVPLAASDADEADDESPDDRPRQLDATADHTHFYADYSSFYALMLLMGMASIIVLIYFWEACFLRTTLCPIGCRGKTPLQRVQQELKAVRGTVLDLLPDHMAGRGSLVSVATGGGQGAAPAKEPLPPTFDENDRKKFWEDVEQRAKDPSTMTKAIVDRRLPSIVGYDIVDVDVRLQHAKDGQSVIEFTRQEFSGFEADKVAHVVIERTGDLKERMTVKLKTMEDESSSGFKAIANMDFVPLEDPGKDHKLITFEADQRQVEVPITLLPTDTTWTPTRWFLLKMYDPSEGAVLGGPNVATWTEPGVMVRVFILQDDSFPPNLPDSEAAKADSISNNTLLWYYFKERIAARKHNFWYTMLGMCYPPVHSVVVTPLIISFVLDWGADPSAGGNYERLILLGSIQMASYLLLRWADISQVRHRGRTGGCRQVHRQQLLSKLLMMEHAEQFKYPGEQWFYSALMNVDTMVVSGYWQMFVMAQSIVGLILAFAVLVGKGAYKASQDPTTEFAVGNMVPTLSFLIVTPISLAVINSRRKRVALLLEKRMKGEEDWVETFAWISANGPQLFSMGTRELAHLEKKFTMSSKKFQTWHVEARDYINDTTWVTKWLGATVYCLIVVWASFRLLQYNAGVAENFQAGDCVLLIQLFGKFTSYLEKISNSVVQMQKAGVSLRKVRDLLNLPEKNSLCELGKTLQREASYEAKKRKEKDEAAAAATTLAMRGEASGGVMSEGEPDAVVFRNVKLEVAKDGPGLGPVASLFQKEGTVGRIPLGKVVILRGGTEAQRFSVLSLAAGVVQPQEGSVTVPRTEWAILMPAAPTVMPFVTIAEDYVIAGASPEAARNLAEILDLEHSAYAERLPPGKALVHCMGRCLLRDPMVLYAVRPLSSMPAEVAENAVKLLMAWQACGGREAFVRMLEKDRDEREAELEEKAVLSRVAQRRTLVFSGEELPSWLPQDRVVHVTIDDFLKAHQPHRGL